jgi:PKD repeat protein
VKFTDQSTGLSLTKWNWSFGDNSWYNTTIAGQKDPIHVYNSAGAYTAKLTVCNISGCNTTIPGTTIFSTIPTIIPTNSITVTVPNGGEIWPRMMGTGTPRLIKWSYTGNPGSTVKIELLKGAAFYKLLNSSTSIGGAGSGSYPWTISADTALGTDYKMRVTSTSNSVYNDTSNTNFIIN